MWTSLSLVDIFPGFKAQAAPMERAVLTPTAIAIQYAAATRNGPHPNAAKLFINFFLSNTAQGQYNGFGYGTMSPVPGIKGLGALPKESPIFVGTPPAAQVQRVYSLLGLR